MLDTETKRRIDSCRDILVGKVPDPKSQVEQITIALIYKFMDDMDAEAEELGGKRKFFAGEYAKYGWAKLMAPGMGGHEVLGLYAEAIAKMNENPGVPTLFRDIFKNAYLPYRDPETLKSFLKEINVFSYDHSEKLGDAFEYLLSVLGSQGDAGQFRTPRHIIDFMVALMDPKKDETVLDPACGTAGFLISAYKHILANNTQPGGRPGDHLKPNERKRLAENIQGYDISPDMVRLSLANLYLHGFANPRVEEYDTLTSDTKWNECADVILANPPFMSPKGGIKPHNKFSVQATRSEVLFVDYIAEHLTPGGRAAIVVPEGIIFQSQTAYKKLRQMLVKDSLMAVISLPAGVFQPYSGVKTSILILDKRAAKVAPGVLFVKVENDGFGLGAQRREMKGSDLPGVGERVKGFLKGEVCEGGLVVERERILESGDVGLSGERYAVATAQTGAYEYCALEGLCDYVRGITYSKADEVDQNGVAVLRANNINQKNSQLDLSDLKLVSSALDLNEKQKLRRGDILICAASGSADHVGKVAYADKDYDCYFGGFMAALRTNAKVEPKYLFEILKTPAFRDHLAQSIAGANIHNLKASIVHSFQIPLPPLEIQREIVAEIEGYQKVIDGARMVVENWKPRIEFDPQWPMVEMETFARLINGRAYKQEELLDKGPTPVLRVGNFFSNRSWYYSDLELDADKYCDKGDLLYAWSASFGPRIWEGPRAIFHYHIWKVEVTDAMDKDFLFYLLELDSEKIKSEGNGIAMAHATKGGMEKRLFPLPPLATQQAIVAEIQAEQSLVNSTCELITRFEQKIQSAIARVWGAQETNS